MPIQIFEKIKPKDPIVICDIGASPCDNVTFIETLISNTNCILYGFEPNEDEFKKLTNNEKRKYYNYAIGNGEDQTLNICKAPGMTSILEPDLEYLDLFHGFKDWAEIIEKKKINTKKLDEVEFEKKIDFFKIDVQGYEHEIINFGQKKLNESLIIQIETSPEPIYKGEKPFSEISSQLEKLDFQLHMFNNINSRCFKPMTFNNNIYEGLHNLFQLDCVFIKKIKLIDEISIEELKKMAMILFYSFNSIDLVDLLIDKISKIENIDYIKDYRDYIKNLKIKKIY